MSFFHWFTQFENTKPLSLIIFFSLFIVIIFYLYGSPKKGKQIEAHKIIPLQDEE